MERLIFRILRLAQKNAHLGEEEVWGIRKEANGAWRKVIRWSLGRFEIFSNKILSFK
jgi:hypothetical protein